MAACEPGDCRLEQARTAAVAMGIQDGEIISDFHWAAA